MIFTRHTALITFLFIFSSGCIQKMNDPNAELVRLLNPSEKFVKNITPDPGTVKFLKTAENSLGLDSLSAGFDSLQIRVWNGCASANRSGNYWLIAFILDKDGWKGEFSDLFVEQSVISCIHDSLSRKIFKLQPNSGWDNFITKLFRLQVLSLPDFSKIRGHEEFVVADGCGITIEIATKRVYRSYGYETPDLYADKYEEVENVIKIIRLIEDEFQIRNKMPVYDKSKKVNSDSITMKEVRIEEIKPKANNE